MISKETAEHYIWGENCDGWILLKQADLSVIHERIPPNNFEIRHYHTKARQFFSFYPAEQILKLTAEAKFRKHMKAQMFRPMCRIKYLMNSTRMSNF